MPYLKAQVTKERNYNFVSCMWVVPHLMEEHRLMVFENRVQGTILGPKREEVVGNWKKLRNEDLHDIYTSPNIIRMTKLKRMRLVGLVACVGEKFAESLGKQL
jgi:hypothetical protein